MYIYFKLLHIISVVMFLGNIFTGVFWMHFAVKSRDVKIVAHTIKGVIRSDRLFTLPGVVLITTFGIVAGFLALVAVLKNDAFTAFIWLGVALFVDGVDGSLARKARVAEYTPNFDGASLDLVIDYVTYVTAHETGHQWWAHQVIGADMQGQTVLSETLAQYSALMAHVSRNKYCKMTKVTA